MIKKSTPIAILFLLFITQFLHAQFPGKHPEILLNHEVKVTEIKPESQKYGYKNFYDNERMDYKDVYKGDTSTKYEELVGKTFKVTEVKPYVKFGESKFILVLTSPQMKKPIYYNYDPTFEYDYHFEVVGGLVLPEGLYCEDIEVIKDKFSDKITSTSPMTDGVRFVKVTEKSESVIYITMNQTGSTASVGKTGLILLLANGKKIEKPEEPLEVKVNTASSNYVYSVFTRLTEEDIKLLLESPITDKRLYVYDGTIQKGQKLMEYLKCLVK